MQNEREPILARPETVMRRHLDADELRLYDEAKADRHTVAKVNWSAPSVAAYLVHAWLVPLVLGAVLLVALITFALIRNSFGRFTAGALFVTAGAMLIGLEVRLWLRTYTRYVVTPDRVMRMEGILNRSASSIGLLAITDVSSNVGIIGQFLDFGVVTIETANEASKFRELTDVPRPRRFLDWLDYARDNKVRPPKPTPLNDAALRALVSIESLISGGELMVERAPSGTGWRLKRDVPPKT